MAKEVTEEKSLKLLKQGKIDKIPKKFFSDKEFIIKAIKLVGGDDVIKRASESIKKDKDIVYMWLKEDLARDTIDDYKEIKEMLLEAKLNGRDWRINCIPDELKTDKEVVYYGLKSLLLKRDIKDYSDVQEMYREAIERDSYIVNEIPNEYKKDRAFLFEVAVNNSYAMVNIENNFIMDSSFSDDVSRARKAVEYIKDFNYNYYNFEGIADIDPTLFDIPGFEKVFTKVIQHKLDRFATKHFEDKDFAEQMNRQYNIISEAYNTLMNRLKCKKKNADFVKNFGG